MLAVSALVLVLVPVPAGADEAGTGNGAVAATGPCEAGWVFDAAANECSQRQTQPADLSCRDAVGTRAVTLSGNDCVTTSAHTTLPTYTCDAAEGWALVGGDPPSCQRTVSREVTTTVTVTDMVHFPESYQHRVAPLTERVRVEPFTRTYMGMETYTYTVRVRYCAQYDTEFGTGCVRWAYRDETRTGVRETLITEPAYNYEDRDVFNYRDETRTGVRETLITEPAYNYEDRDVFNYETRTRQRCCRPETTEVTITETVTVTESGVPGAECTAAGYTMSSASVCSQPAGVRLQGATYECDTGWAAAAGDPTTCERTATGTPEWECPADHTLDAATTPPHCHLQQQPQDPEEGTDAQTCSTTSLGTLGTGRVTRSGSWAAGCRSTQLGSDQTPYWAQSFTFAVDGAATADLDVTSSGDPYVFVINSGGTAVGSDDDSGSDGRDSRIRGLRLPRGSYTIEATTSGPRQTGSFALALDLTVTVAAPQPGVTVPAPQPGVTISGLAAADGTPQAGAATATVTDQFDVTPADALCTAAPAGATIAPDAGGTRFLTHSVPAGTTVTVTVTCTSGTQTDTATARFTANAAPVAITGLGHAVGTPASGAATAEVTGTFDVAPTDAVCTAAPAGATIAPDAGGTRTLAHSVPAGTKVLVRVTCTAGTQTGTATAWFTANPDPATTDCDSSLDTFSAAGAPVRGTISSEGGCTSVRRRPNSSSVYHARRHVLVLTSPGWATVTLESAASNPQRLDTYLILLHGDAPDGSGAKITHNDDASNASSHGLHGRDSRIAGRFLQTGTYTIEATTFRRYSALNPQRSTGDYILRVSVDHTPRATSQPAELRVQNGDSITRTWAYEPGAATVAIASAFPDGITAAVSRYTGTITREVGRATLTATPSEVGTHTVTVAYANGPGSLSKDTTIHAFDGSCPPTPYGHRARQVHHHENGNGHLGCQAHTPPACVNGPTNLWTPSGGGHPERNLKSCLLKENSGIVDPEYLPWSPYDVDGSGDPVLCPEVSRQNLHHSSSQALPICLRNHHLTVFTWSSGFDIDIAIREYEAENGRQVPTRVRRDLEAIQRAVDNRETILVGTHELPQRTGSETLDEAFVQIVCEGVVGYAVDQGVDAAAKKVGGWAKNRFPTGTVLQGAIKISTILSIAETFASVFYENFATNVACD